MIDAATSHFHPRPVNPSHNFSFPLPELELCGQEVCISLAQPELNFLLFISILLLASVFPSACLPLVLLEPVCFSPSPPCLLWKVSSVPRSLQCPLEVKAVGDILACWCPAFPRLYFFSEVCSFVLGFLSANNPHGWPLLPAHYTPVLACSCWAFQSLTDLYFHVTLLICFVVLIWVGLGQGFTFDPGPQPVVY